MMTPLGEGPMLVLAPHPDDEVLGCGGAIGRHAAAGGDVHVAIVTKAGPPLFGEDVARTGRSEARAAHAVLGVVDTHLLDFPAAGLDRVAHADLNRALDELVASIRPSTVFVPFAGDLHADHQAVFRSALVATRPGRAGAPGSVLAYETLSETNWRAPTMTPAFDPNVFVDVSDHLERKLEAMACYASQLRPSPHERSLVAIRALAELRGSTVGVAAAEAFVLIRELR